MIYTYICQKYIKQITIQTKAKTKTPSWMLVHRVALQVGCKGVYGKRKGGSSQEGSLCAWNMEKEHSREILDRFFMSVLWFTLIWLCLSELIMDALLRFVIKPLDPISKGTRLTVQPAAFKSSLSPLYLELFIM